MKGTVRHPRSARHPRGVVLITAMWIAIALTAVVLVLCREMQVESMTVRQHLAQAKVDAAEVGVEQYVMSIIEQELITPGYKDQVTWQQRPIGECYYWVLTPNLDDETQPAYGLTDEASKLDINYATEEMMEYLPGLDQNPSIAAAIYDWRNPASDTPTSNITSGAVGAQSDYYDANFGYYAKNAFFENLDELRLVDGLTDPATADPYLWGADANHNWVIEPAEAAAADPGMTFELTMRGLMPYITIWGYQATNPPLMVATTDSLGNVTDATPTPPTTVDEITFQTPLDVNNPANSQGTNSLLSQLLQQYLPAKATAIITATRNRIAPTAARGGPAPAATPFTSLWDWIATMNTAPTIALNSQDLSTPTADGTPLYNLLTCIPKVATTAASTTITPTAANPTGTPPPTQFAKLNVNTASEEALMCIPGFAQTDADDIIAYRETNLTDQALQDPLQVPNISWLLDALDPLTLAQAKTWGPWITGSSTVYSADIVTVSLDGRAFKRVMIVVDDSSGTPVIVYRRDLTDAGWPLDPSIRAALRKGQPLNTATTGNGAASAGRLSFGAH